MINILQKIGAGLLAVAVAITGFFGMGEQITYLQERINELEIQLVEQSGVILGAYYPVGTNRVKLAGSGVGTTDTSVELQSLTMPISGRELAMADFGDIGYATMDPGNPSKKEFISFTGITQSGSSDKATLTGVSRGLSFVTPYSASTTLRSSHSGGSILIFSNSPAFYSEFTIKKNDATITGTWTFDADAYPLVDDATQAPSADGELATKKYADDLAIAGAADATISVKGIIEIATIADVASMAAASSSDTTAMIVVPTYYFATTSKATTSVVVTHTDGKIDQNFIDLTEAYVWTGAHSHSATSTFTNDIDMDGLDLDSANDTLTITASTSISTSSFLVIPHIPNATPTDSFHIASKDYVDNKTARKGYQSIARAYRSGSTQDLGTATWAKVQLNAETFDELGEFDSTTNYRFTATTTGYYHVIGSILFLPGAADSSCFVQVRVNNGEATSTIISFPAVSSLYGSNLSDYFSLTAGDYVELWGKTTHASALAYDSASSTYMVVTRVY